MSLYRVIYKSVVTVPPVPWELISSILAKSAENNKNLQITGILLASETEFFQVLEGEQEPLNMLYHHIVKDERHADLFLISYDLIEKRDFSKWSMRGVGLNDLGGDFTSFLKEKYGTRAGQLVFPTDRFQAFALLYDVVVYLGKNSPD